MNSLVAGTIVFRQYQSKYSNGRLNQNGIVAVQYMCIGHLILGLSKVLEFRKHYHYLIPFDLIEVFKDLTNKLSKSHVKELRNTVFAHVLDRRLKRSKTQLEVVELLEQLSSKKPTEFLDWLNNENHYEYPSTVWSIIKELRDYLIKGHDVKKEEGFFR